MRSILTDSCFRWAEFDFKDRAAYRAYRADISNRAAPDGHVETELALFVNDINWDQSEQPCEAFFFPGDHDEVRRWVAGVMELLGDVEIPWRNRNVQGLAVTLRELAEHVGVGSLAFGSTYALSEGHPVIPQFVLGPILLGPDQSFRNLSGPRVAWGRRRMECLLTKVTLDKYDGLTMLAGYAHPGRFGNEAYLDGDLIETGPKLISRSNPESQIAMFAPIILRLLKVTSLLVRTMSHA